MMDQACIFNIQKFSIHDGPGIRTVVFSKVARSAVTGVPIPSLKLVIQKICGTLKRKITPL